MIAAFAARAIILFAMLPAIARLGLTTSLNQRQKTLVWWGGVRGAVTLILTLSLSETTALSEAERQMLGALGCGFVLVTLLINAGSLARVTHWLGLDRLSESNRRLRQRIVAATMAEGRDHVLALAGQRAVEPAVIADIEAAYQTRLDEAGRVDAGHAAPLRRAPEARPHHPRQPGKAAVQATLRGWRDRRDHHAHPGAPQADRLADATRLRGREGYEAMMTALLAVPRRFRLALFLQRWLRQERPLARLLARRFDVLVENRKCPSGALPVQRQPHDGADRRGMRGTICKSFWTRGQG